MRLSVNVSRSARLALAVSLVATLLGSLALRTPATAQSANPIIAENANEGTTAWREFQGSFRNGDDGGLQVKGYASATSVAAGETLTLFVTVNPAQAVTIDIYRMGWYGGTGGRLMRHIGPLNGITQPPCTVD